jgi:hypothetical protein
VGYLNKLSEFKGPQNQHPQKHPYRCLCLCFRAPYFPYWELDLKIHLTWLSIETFLELNNPNSSSACQSSGCVFHYRRYWSLGKLPKFSCSCPLVFNCSSWPSVSHYPYCYPYSLAVTRKLLILLHIGLIISIKCLCAYTRIVLLYIFVGHHYLSL